MIRFLIPKAGFILRMQIYTVYRNTQTILRTWPGRFFPVTNADLRRRDRADAEYKHSYNRPTRTYAPRSTQEYLRHYARICVDSFAQFGLRTTGYGV